MRTAAIVESESGIAKVMNVEMPRITRLGCLPGNIKGIAVAATENRIVGSQIATLPLLARE